MATEPLDPSEIPTDDVVQPDDITGDPEVTWTKEPIPAADWTLQGVVIDPVPGSDIDEGAEVIPPPPEPEPPVEPVDPPAAPSNLTATLVGTNQIDLAWIRNSIDESGFRIERSQTSGSGFAEIATVGPATLTYSDINLAVDTTFFYRVIAFNSGGDSPPSNEASEATPPDVLAPDGAPSNLIAITVDVGIIDLQWADNSSNELTFRIERSDNPTTGFAEIAFVGPGIESYKDETALPAEQQFFYRVRAANIAGVSDYSNVASGGGVIYSNGFANRYVVKVRPNQVSNTLNNFMIRMELQFDALKLEAVDPINGKVRTPLGLDIRFEELTGVKMEYDRRSYSGVNGTIECWIESKVFFVEHAFYMYVGNETIVAPEADAVAMWADVATMALDCLNGIDFAGKQTVTVVNPASADTLLGEAGKGLATFTVPTQPLFDGDTEQSSMCWVRSDEAPGTDKGWVESLAPTSYPSGDFAAWVQRYDADGFLGGSVNLIKYGCAGENFETNSNRQTPLNQFFAMTWKGGQYPSLYIDGGSPEFQDAGTGLPGAALAGAPGEVLEFYNGLANWTGVFDEYIQFDRQLSQAFVNAAYNSQKSTANFLFINPNEGAVAVPGEDIPDITEPEPPAPPTPQPTSSWEEFFLDRTLPVIPTENVTVPVTTFAELDAAIAAAVVDVGVTTRIELQNDLDNVGTQDRFYNFLLNTTVIIDFKGFEINNSNNQCRLTFDGVMSDWDPAQQITRVVTAGAKTTLTFLNLPAGLQPGHFLKAFAPRIDSTTDWRLGSNIWARIPSSNRIGQAYEVESINGNDVLLNDFIRDPIGQYDETAKAGRLYGSFYVCGGVNYEGSLYLIDPRFRNTGPNGNIRMFALAKYHVIRPYIENNVVTSGFPNKISMGGVRGKMYDAFFDSQLTGGMGFVYAWHALGGSSQNVAVNTDAFNRPYNMRQFRDYGDSSSFNLNTGDSEHDMARKAGNPSLWGINRGIVQDTGGQGATSTHSGSVDVRFNQISVNNSPGVTHNLFMSFRAVSGANMEGNIIEGLVLLNTDFINDALWQFYNESADDGSGNSNGTDNGCFGYLIRNNLIHWTKGALYFLSGQNATHGPLKFGEGNEIHIKKSGEIFFFDAGTSNDKPIDQILPDPRPDWEVRGGSTYHVYNNSGGRMGSLRNGAQCNWDFPIIDLSQRTTPYTLMDAASGTLLTGGAQLINPNNVQVTPATGAGNRSGFSVVTL